MRQVETVAALRTQLAEWRDRGQRIALVPTMGNLHAGHYSLLARAREAADRVVTSIFVNPGQFGPGEDFERYPRTPEADAEGLQRAGCDLLFLPSVAEMYPLGLAQRVQMRVPQLGDILCGASRPGHFDGVCTVVARLFLQVQPDVAVFGQKDYQQLAIIRHMVRDLAFPIEILGAATARADDGLALSSRNQYLDPVQRLAAPKIYQTLQWMAEHMAGADDFDALCVDATQRLTEAGFTVDYVAIRRADLGVADSRQQEDRVALIAAKLGTTRLIDNLQVPAGDDPDGAGQ